MKRRGPKPGGSSLGSWEGAHSFEDEDEDEDEEETGYR